MSRPTAGRNDALDGFRGLAIFAVVAFHYLADLARVPGEATKMYPFGEAYGHVPFLIHGNMGVQLFFIISGFVISLTLETSTSPFDFAVKRIARLVPAMLLCSVVTAAAVTLLPFKTWHVQALDFLPSWTFTSEHTWSWLLGRPVFFVDTVYWTLCIEVKFYILAALVHFYLRRVSLMTVLGVLVFAQIAIGHVFFKTPASSEVFKNWSMYDYMPLFLAGVAFRRLSIDHIDRKAIFFVVTSMLLLIARAKSGLQEDALIVLFYSLFVGMIYAPRSVAMFTWRPMVALGAWSYSLYLLHNRIGVALTYNVGMVSPDWLRHSVLIPVSVGALLAFVSMLVFRYWEVPMRGLIRRLAARGGRSPTVDPRISSEGASPSAT